MRSGELLVVGASLLLVLYVLVCGATLLVELTLVAGVLVVLVAVDAESVVKLVVTTVDDVVVVLCPKATPVPSRHRASKVCCVFIFITLLS